MTLTKTFRLSLITACTLLISSTPMTVGRGSVRALVKNAPQTEARQELARARGATAKYHDVAEAEADGYVNIGLNLPGEGLHYVNFSLIDGTFDPEQPEVLLYASVDGETGLHLVAVEYLVPLSPNPPTGFTGDDDEWRQDTEGFGLWELTVWLWLQNPEGVFADDNPRIP